MTIQETPREEKLLHFYNGFIIPRFAAQGYTLPVNVKMSIGKTSSEKAIGECWHPETGKGYYHIFISPKILRYGEEMLHVLIHEAIHTLFFDHKKQFSTCAAAVGLLKPWKSTTASNKLAADITQWCTDNDWTWTEPSLVGAVLPGKKKQTTRMIKLECPCCGYIVRTSRKNIEEFGLPLCPQGTEFEDTTEE